MTDESHIRLAERHRIADWLEKRAAACDGSATKAKGDIYWTLRDGAGALRAAAAELRKMDT